MQNRSSHWGVFGLALGIVVAWNSAVASAADAPVKSGTAPSRVMSAMTLAQDAKEQNGGVRFRGRSIKGLIYLAVAAGAGIGWVIKKVLGSGGGSDSNESSGDDPTQQS